ncbi:MAG: hypothetical protein HYS15_03500 [Candidatus Spechtbacteria bacterium]|nr:hypothetical protein [Candidatus Spechtbacteria bacterium]
MGKVKHTAIIFLCFLALGIFGQIYFANAQAPACNPETDLSCPREGGLIPCGRNSDDPTTFVVESQPCNACHFFFLFQRVANWITFRFAPIFAVLLVALGGFFITTSQGNASRLKLGKDIALWVLIGYATILSSWIVVNSALATLDAVTWTGLRSEKGGWWQFSCGASETKISNITKDAQVAVKVAPAPVINFTADQEKIPEVGSTNFRWSVQNAEKCEAFGAEFWSGEKSALQGASEIMPPPFPRDYKLILSCQGQGGTRSKEISLFVESANPPVKTVFITSRTYSANLGGLTGADQKCQDRANAAGVPGTFRAWLSDKTKDAVFRIKPHNENSPFYRLDRKKIADSWAELTGGSLEEQININEFTKEASLYEEGAGVFSSLVWTATKTDGTLTNSGDSDCSQWSTSASSEEKGPGLGDFMKKNSFWTKAGTNTHCDSIRPLYCFETD